jgi:hypothetical protein
MGVFSTSVRFGPCHLNATPTPPYTGRCAVVFSEPRQILACLEAIAADGEVDVVRVNNKLAHDYDAHITAGYRCVAAPPAPRLPAWGSRPGKPLLHGAWARWRCSLV